MIAARVFPCVRCSLGFVPLLCYHGLTDASPSRRPPMKHDYGTTSIPDTGMPCGVVSVIFTHLVTWFIEAFEFLKEKFDIPAVACPALGALVAGMIAIKYPGILYWGFNNVDEILHTGRSASASGIWLLAQLAATKIIVTALCKGSGLVGGLYAPSLMIGAAVGAVFGGSAAELINAAIPEIQLLPSHKHMHWLEWLLH